MAATLDSDIYLKIYMQKIKQLPYLGVYWDAAGAAICLVHFDVTCTGPLTSRKCLLRVLKHVGILEAPTLSPVIKHTDIASHAKRPFNCGLYAKAADLNSLTSGTQ